MIASKTPERLTDAPASITAYAQEDLRALGLQTLGEVAGMTAGYGNYVMYGEEVLSTRGQKAGSFNNNKHLVYYDGIPINFARNGKAPIDEELPIAYASRVEFLRGPASALYGTGSFFGVINVVPGELDRDGIRSDLRMGLGTFSDEKRVTGNVLQSSSVGLLRLTAGAFTREASLLQVGTRPNPDNLMRDDLHTVFLNASYTLRETPLAGLTVAFLYMRKASGLGESWLESTLTSRANQLTWETILPYLKYERSLGQRLTLRSYLIWNAGRETGLLVAALARRPARLLGGPATSSRRTRSAPTWSRGQGRAGVEDLRRGPAHRRAQRRHPPAGGRAHQLLAVAHRRALRHALLGRPDHLGALRPVHHAVGLLAAALGVSGAEGAHRHAGGAR